MEAMNIEEFSQQLQQLIKERDQLKNECDWYHDRLCRAIVNAPGCKLNIVGSYDTEKVVALENTGGIMTLTINDKKGRERRISNKSQMPKYEPIKGHK